MSNALPTKLKYAVVYDDENLIVTGYYDTEQEAIAQAEKDTGRKWPHEAHSIQGFTATEILEIEAYSETHPQ